MIYAQYFRGESDNYQTACGMDAIRKMDRRFSRARMLTIARSYGMRTNECLGKGYTAFQLMEGSTYSRSVPLTPIIPLEYDQ